MLYVKPPGTDAAAHFSVEEYFMDQFPLDTPLFMIWQAERTAMLGSYQLAETEVNLPFAQEAGIEIVRRQSGGGTIFTDLGTLLYTLILPQTAPESCQEIVREIFAAPLCRALHTLGIPAELEGRNDILVEGKKVAGIAQYARRGRVCTHGSLLYDTDLDMLAAVLQVDAEKISSKAIRSVRSRVTNLSAYMEVSVSTPDFWALLEGALSAEWDLQAYSLTDADLAAIEAIRREKYGNPAWNFGRAPRFSFHNSKRFPGGKVEIFLDIARGLVAACSIRGDFLGTVPIRDLEIMLEKQAFRYDAVDALLAEIDLRPFLGDISKTQFLSCLFE